MKLNRRELFKLSGAGALGTAFAFTPSFGAAQKPVQNIPKMLPDSNGNRVVIVGGGWAGVTAAKYIKKEHPKAEVVLIEKRKVFFSCPISNTWLADMVNLDFLIHDFQTPAAKYGYTFINATVVDIDRDKKRVYTNEGYVGYDYLVLAPGIRYNYSAWFGDDKEMARYCATHYPSAFIPGSEHIALKRKIENFEEGDFVLVVPPPPHRCPPAPYERAAMIAYMLKQNDVKGRVIILDPKDKIKPKGPGFMGAYEQLYLDMVDYVPNAKVKEIDPVNKVIKTTAGDFKFADANINPPHQAGDLVWKAGLIGKNKDGKPTGWAAVDPLTLQSKADPNIFLAGDVVAVKGFPKSGHMANSHSKNMLVKALVALMKGKDPKEAVKAPDNTCYSMVNGEPQEAIVVSVKYELDKKAGAPKKAGVKVINERSSALAKATFEWAKSFYRDMFS